MDIVWTVTCMGVFRFKENQDEDFNWFAITGNISIGSHFIHLTMLLPYNRENSVSFFHCSNFLFFFSPHVLSVAEPVRPIDPAAWITHTSALTGTYPRYGMSPSMSIITCTSSSLTSSIPESESKSHCSPRIVRRTDPALGQQCNPNPQSC